MKKVFLIVLAFVVVATLIHLTTPRYGGLPGVWHRSQGRVITKVAQLIKDPGMCTWIRGYWGRTLHEKLRDRCADDYFRKEVRKRSDCHVTELTTDKDILAKLSFKDEYRYACLLQHFQIMLGNSLTREWLPEGCLEARDALVVFGYYLSNVRHAYASGRGVDTTTPLSLPNLDTVYQCEELLDTEKVYSFLRRDNVSPGTFSLDEQEYIEEQKEKMSAGEGLENLRGPAVYSTSRE